MEPPITTKPATTPMEPPITTELPTTPMEPGTVVVVLGSVVVAMYLVLSGRLKLLTSANKYLFI
jgi:hypothetical protein